MNCPNLSGKLRGMSSRESLLSIILHNVVFKTDLIYRDIKQTIKFYVNIFYSKIRCFYQQNCQKLKPRLNKYLHVCHIKEYCNCASHYISHITSLCNFFTASPEEIMELSFLVYIAERDKSSVNHHWITHIGKLRKSLPKTFWNRSNQCMQWLQIIVSESMVCIK